MELHYKVYQKVRIYLDKIQCALPNLETMKLRTMYFEYQMLITVRVTALHLIRAEILDFFRNFKNPIPYVPSSRCRAITSWYGCSKLRSLRNFSGFQQDLIEADKEVTDQAGYIISDGNVPIMLKNLMKKHLERFGKVQEQKEILKGS